MGKDRAFKRVHRHCIAMFSCATLYHKPSRINDSACPGNPHTLEDVKERDVGIYKRVKISLWRRFRVIPFIRRRELVDQFSNRWAVNGIVLFAESLIVLQVIPVIVRV